MGNPDLGSAVLHNQSQLLCDSYQYWTGKPLLSSTVKRVAEDLFNAPFVLVSHGTENVPVFNYATRRALELFEMDWDTFVQLPSSQSADQQNQPGRAALMSRVKAEGFVTGASGVRVTAGGRRFRISGATVWNVVDGNGAYHGQAAMFDQWHYLDE